MFEDKKIIEYVIMNPSGNITALVTSDVEDECEYGFIAKKLLELEPTVEQVGFLQYDDESDIILNMAGGEFCGNATMSAAVYYGILHGISDGNVVVKSSGADEPVNVHIKKNNVAHAVRDYGSWEGIVEMPLPLEISEVDFGNGEKYPVVFFKGIAHVIVDRDAIGCSNECEEELLDKNTNDCNNKIKISDRSKKGFENKIKEWCEGLEVPAMGIIICDSVNSANWVRGDEGSASLRPYDGDVVPSEIEIIPLVYVGSIDSLYWESSCASGTTAVGAYVVSKTNKEISVDVRQPSGVSLEIERTSDNKILLKGRVKYICLKSKLI